MFLKSKNNNNNNNTKQPSLPKKELTPSIVASCTSLLGNMVSEGDIDFDGTVDGNIRAKNLTIRHNASVKGEVVAESVAVYGTVKGLIRAQNVHLHASCTVEGIIMHETLKVEDGATVDGKFKRTNKPTFIEEPEETEEDTNTSSFKNESSEATIRILENIRLIR